MDFVIKKGVLKEYCGNATEVLIPKGVRKIGDGAFKRPCCRKITRLTVPEGVTAIGNFAFQELEALTDLTLPSTLQTIGSQAFSVCRALTELQIPDGVTTIGFGTFEYCSRLETVRLPKGLTQIPEKAFRMCGRLTRVNIPEGVTEIGDFAFAWCGELTELQLPESVEKLGTEAFYDCRRLKKINIPRGCFIDPKAFTCCYSLADPEGMVILQNRLFIHYPDDNGKTPVVIPDFVEAIEDGAFVGRIPRQVEMNLRCPLWKADRGKLPFLHLRSLFTADGSTITFRDDTGKAVAKVILAIHEELEPDQLCGKLSIRQKDHAFDFAWYDASWEMLKQLRNRLRVALVRLQYPYALPDRVRKLYEGAVAEHSLAAGKLVIDGGDSRLLGMLLAKGLLRRDTLSELVDYANQAGAVTMTAQLLAARHAAPKNPWPL